MKQRILVARAVFPEVVEALARKFEVEHNVEDRPWSPEELGRRLAGKQGAMTTVMDKVDDAVLVVGVTQHGIGRFGRPAQHLVRIHDPSTYSTCQTLNRL